MSDVQSSTTLTSATNTVATQEFTITKAMLQGYLSKGMTVPEISAEISKESKFKCSDAVVRRAAKAYSIDLRLKPKKSPFVFETQNG